MSQRKRKTCYWQDAPVPRDQLVLIPRALEDMIPEDHPVRLVDEILDQLNWNEWEATYHGSFGQPPIHPAVIANLSELCIDGTRVLANANKYKTWTAKRLARALEELDAQIAEALEAFEVNDALDEDLLGQDISADSLPAAVRDLKTRREQLDALMKTAESMDEARQKNGSKGPAQIPKTDTDSRILPNKEGGFAANFTPMATSRITERTDRDGGRADR